MPFSFARAHIKASKCKNIHEQSKYNKETNERERLASFPEVENRSIEHDEVGIRNTVSKKIIRIVKM